LGAPGSDGATRAHQATENTTNLHFFNFTVVFEVFLPLNLDVRFNDLVLGFGGNVFTWRRRQHATPRATMQASLPRAIEIAPAMAPETQKRYEFATTQINQRRGRRGRGGFNF
jgi:hypothetical protein